MRDMTSQDAERLHRLITRHAHYTNSDRAKTILADWKTWQSKFRKVMPVDYRRALAEMAKQQEAHGTGLDELEIGVASQEKRKGKGKGKATAAE